MTARRKQRDVSLSASVVSEEVLSIHERLEAPGQRCPECGESAVAGERTRRAVCIEGNGIHAVYSICGACSTKSTLGIIEEFQRVINGHETASDRVNYHLVSAESFAVVAADVTSREAVN
jgi:hypothetical protein